MDSSIVRDVAGVAGTLLFGATVLWHQRLARTLRAARPRRAPLPEYPSVTMVRPVRGADVGAEDNFRAALDTGYPGPLETLFIFDDEDDPGLPIARRVVAEHRAAGRPGRADVLVAGPPPPGRTGKLNAMMLGEARATGTLIGFGDSDTRPDRDVLRGVVEALLATPTAGAAFAPVLVDQPPQHAGDALYAIMQNALYSPIAAYASGPSRTLPFIMGQLMVFRREALRAVGGVRCAEGQLVDDMAIGQHIHAAGWANVMSRAPLHIATGGMTLAEFVPIFRRWMMFAKNGLPLSFSWRQWAVNLGFWVALVLALLGFAAGSVTAALPGLAALFVIGASQVALHHLYGGAPMPPRLWWTGWGVFAVAPYVLALNLLQKRVDWRGRLYDVDGAAALAAAPAGAHALAGAAEDVELDGLSQKWSEPATEPAQHP